MARPKTDAAEFVHFPLRLPKEVLDIFRARAAQSGAPINTELVRGLRQLIQHDQADAQDDRRRLAPLRPRRATVGGS